MGNATSTPEPDRHDIDLTGLFTNPDEAIQNLRLVVLSFPDGHPDKPLWLSGLGECLHSRFEQTGVLSDLEEAIKNFQRAVLLTPDSDPDRPARLNNLGTSLCGRFRCTGVFSDLDKAIRSQQEALLLTSHSDPAKPARLTNLGASFHGRFEHTGALSDLEEATKNQQHAVLLTPDGHPHKPARLHNLGICLHSQFEQTGALRDLEKAIRNQQQAVLLVPDGHPEKSGWLSSLGNSFDSRFEHTGKFSDLEEAIKNQRRAVLLTPDGHPRKPLCLNNLGTSFHARFKRTGVFSDLDEAMKYQQEAVLLTPDSHLDKPARLNNLGNFFLTRFRHRGILSDLEKAIENQQRAILLTPHEHSEKTGWLNNLGNSFRARFDRTGALSDLEEAIKNQQQAVLLSPHGHPRNPGFHDNLGTSFYTRFKYTGVSSDLEQAIRHQQQALLLTLDGHPDKPARLNNLGNSFQSRFGETSVPSDLDEAIKDHQLAVSLTPDGHPDKLGRLNNLGNSFKGRFEYTGTLSDLDEAIKYQQQAVLLTPDGHLNKPGELSNLGNSFRSRFQHTGKPDDLNEAIKHQHQAVLLTPDGHPNKPEFLVSLGDALTQLYQDGSLSDLARAIPHYQSAATSNTGSPSRRAYASQQWARLALLANNDVYSALVACDRAMDLIPQTAWIGDPIATRHSQLHKLGNLPREAAAIALNFGNPDLALEWLEQGRSVGWNQLFMLRTSVADLRQAYPDICAEFTQVARELQSAVTREQAMEPSHDGKYVMTTLEEQTRRHHRLAERWDSLVGEIRSLPNFEGFLLPKRVSVLKKAADLGPVVVINVHKFRCDALVLEPGSDEVLHIPLHKLRYEDMEKMQISLKEYLANPHPNRRWEDRAGRPAAVGGSCIAGILEKLYSSIVYPILQGLGLTTRISDSSQLPRIWWCPTGPLTFLPLHAAGRETPDGREETSDYVVSSYTPTVSALLEARAQNPLPFDKLTGFAMIDSPGLTPLPNAEKELMKIQEVFPRNSRWRFDALRNEQVTGERVLAGMAESSWIHLACHAVQDVREPTQSGLCLHDRRLMVTDIITKPFSNADFAFLSACETAAGDEKVSDEAVHITGAMLGAGYRSVIGTMWSIPDEAAPVVAGKVYESLLSGGEPNSRQAARALHEGVRELRKSGRDSFYSWVPFVHYGV